MLLSLTKKKLFLFCLFFFIFVSTGFFTVRFIEWHDSVLRPPLRVSYNFQNPDELIYPEELKIPPDVIECYKFFGRAEWEWEEYTKFVYHERTETYDVVEDEYGFKYKAYKCPYYLKSFFGKFHFWRAILTVWSEYARALDIEWYLFYGGLIAVVRDGGTPLQWDFDVDIIVNRDDVHKIKRHIPQNLLTHWFMFVHPDHEKNPPDRKSRYACPFPKNKVMPGRCNFQDPVARLIHTNPQETFLDIFGFQKDEMNQYFEEGPYGFLFSESQMKPVKCTYYGVEMNCPQKGEEIVKALYGENYTERPFLCDPESKDWKKVKGVRTKVYDTRVHGI